MDVNCVLSVTPRPFTAAMIASAMPAAIKAYSMAVAPDSLAKNLRKVRFNFASTRLPRGSSRYGTPAFKNLSRGKFRFLNLMTADGERGYGAETFNEVEQNCRYVEVNCRSPPAT